MNPQPASDPPPPANGRLDAQTRGLKNHAHARTQDAERRASQAIRDLLKTGAAINFTSVARVGNISTGFLHRHAELSARIRDLGAQQKGAVEESQALTASGEAAVIAALRRKLRDIETAHEAEVKQLRGRIRELEQQIAALYGRM